MRRLTKAEREQRRADAAARPPEPAKVDATRNDVVVGDDFDAHGGTAAAGYADKQQTEVVGVGRKTKTKPQSELAKALANTPRGVLVARGEAFEVATNGKLEPEGFAAALGTLDGLASRDAPTLVQLASRVGGPFSVVLPPNFEPGRAYRVRPVTSPPKSFDALIDKLATSASPSYLAADEILLVLDGGRIGKWDPVEVAKSRAKTIRGIELSGFTDAVALDGPASGWTKSLKGSKSEPRPSKSEAPDKGAGVRQQAVARAREDLIQRLGALPADSPGVDGLLEMIRSRIPAKPTKTGDELEGLETAVERYAHLADELIAQHGEAPVVVPEAAVDRPPTKVSKADRALLDGVVKRHAGLAKAIETLVAQRPNLFEGKDVATGQTFAKALAEFVDGGYSTKTGVEGLAMFIDRVANRTFEGSVPYYSHTHGICKELVVNHPGVVLKLSQAAIDDEPFELHEAYPKDGARTLPPLPDFKKPFEKSWGRSLGGVPHGYERGLLIAIVDEIAPDRGEIHPDLLHGRSSRAAISFQKITGIKLRYNYAFNLKTGEDLVAALQANGGRGIAMGDIEIRWKKGNAAKPHFPFFTDYDPATKTVRLDNFGGRTYHVPVEGMELDQVAFYHFGDGALDAYLTPDKETLMGDKYPGLKQNNRPPLD